MTQRIKLVDDHRLGFFRDEPVVKPLSGQWASWMLWNHCVEVVLPVAGVLVRW